MALRQPVDVATLENYIATHVPVIQNPITLSQVRTIYPFP